jgi:hypothetical protein
MDRATAFTELTQRNALRRDAKLPLLDLRTEMVLAVELDAHRDYVQHCEEHGDDRRCIMEDVLSNLRMTRGADFPSSIGGRMLVRLMTDQRFQAFLEIEHDIRRPTMTGRHPIKYGELRRSRP